MAGPSSARDRDRTSTHHHHRTISSTTLLLILSLVLAVLAVMLSIPNRSSGNVLNPESPGSGLWGYLTPRRSQVLVARESQVALREAEVARREAELLAGQPGGLTIASCEPCPACAPLAAPPPAPPLQTIIQEITREVESIPSPAPPAVPGWWKEVEGRLETLFDRELKVGDREKDVGRREEQVNRREHDAGRRETWIMEQLLNLGNQPHDVETEEVIYETRKAPKPKVSMPPRF
ncbi:hypothetical protein CALVIDRAFT_532789 [Calocera viscosa TUFC12733]|uniref:Uncharacterized protein n=1 Tax=Calocera viscosa (strain TUFC12733) TaxID=1330018 RepID=A0A167RQQ0_CALVF|nr:hypothetical protein CALVIDRAFT_532789 [Calocera viscosa TUFC12733]